MVLKHTLLCKPQRAGRTIDLDTQLSKSIKHGTQASALLLQKVEPAQELPHKTCGYL